MTLFKFILFFYLFLFTLQADDTTEKNNSLTQIEIVEFIKISDVSIVSTELFSNLDKIEETLVESDTLIQIRKSIKPYVNSLDILLSSPSYKNLDKQSVRSLQKMSSELTIQLKQLEEWNEYISENVKLYDSHINNLKEYLQIWGKTYDHAFSEHAPKEFTQHIISVLDTIAKLQQTVKEKYDVALTNSQLVTTKILELQAFTQTLKEREVIATNRVFYQNSSPLLSTPKTKEFTLYRYLEAIERSLLDKYRESRDYFETNTEYWLRFFIITALVGLFVFYYNYLYRKKRLFVSEVSIGRKIFFFIGRPFATYTLLFMLILAYSFPNRVPAMTELIMLSLLFPMIRVLQSVVEKKHYKYLYFLVSFYILNTLNNNAIGFEFESRVIMFIINLALLLFTFITLKNRLLESTASPFLAKVGKVLLYIFLLILSMALLANLYGAILLSSRVVSGVIAVYSITALFYTFYVILTGYIVVALRRRISSSSNMLDKYSQKIETTTSFLIKIWMLIWWVIIATKLLSVFPYLVEFYKSFMALSWSIAQTTISVSSVLDFTMIVIGTWALARITKTALEVEVFSRFTLPRGAPTAILTTLNYTIIITGTIIAFSSLGVTPQQFALIFGALGVGIGFGLRNIIANFVSGIIMVFERPIQIGDTIEVDKTTGKVQSIGARSSTIKTFDGSEVIIPNADFIAKEIINWTLSDEQRRKVVEFKVALDNDIDKILKIMKDVAISHENVLKDPEPLAVFQGFGEYYLEFKLYFWLSDNLIVAPSDVTLGIYRELQKAGIKMPIPKTDIEPRK